MHMASTRYHSILRGLHFMPAADILRLAETISDFPIGAAPYHDITARPTSALMTLKTIATMPRAVNLVPR